MAKLDAAQYRACDVRPLDDKKWEEVGARLMHLESIFSFGFSEENSHLKALIDGSTVCLTLTIQMDRPRGGLGGIPLIHL